MLQAKPLNGRYELCKFVLMEITSAVCLTTKMSSIQMDRGCK